MIDTFQILAYISFQYINFVISFTCIMLKMNTKQNTSKSKNIFFFIIQDIAHESSPSKSSSSDFHHVRQDRFFSTFYGLEKH